ncbi:MAG: hypothetical protein QXJ21_07520 [Thermofilum sp.]
MDIFRLIKRRLPPEERLRLNRIKGELAESWARTKYEAMGYEVRRTRRGSDFRAIYRNVWGDVVEDKYVEVKSGDSQLSPLQRRMRKRLKRRYVVERYDPFIF